MKVINTLLTNTHYTVQIVGERANLEALIINLNAYLFTKKLEVVSLDDGDANDLVIIAIKLPRAEFTNVREALIIFEVHLANEVLINVKGRKPIHAWIKRQEYNGLTDICVDCIFYESFTFETEDDCTHDDIRHQITYDVQEGSTKAEIFDGQVNYILKF